MHENDSDKETDKVSSERNLGSPVAGLRESCFVVARMKLKW